MKSQTHRQLIQKISLAILCGLLASTCAIRAANIIKADTSDNLDQGAAWVGGVPPTSADRASFNSTVILGNTNTGTYTLGQDTNWLGIVFSNPGTNIVVAAGSTLTLGASGIDMSAATTNLTLQCPVVVGATQTWNVGSGGRLIINAAVSGTNGFIKTGAGVLGFSVANNWTNGTVISNGVVSLDATTASLGSNDTNQNLNVTLAGGSYSNNWGAGNQVSQNNNLIVPTGTTGTIYMGNRIRLASSGRAATLSGGGTLNLVANSTVTRDDIGGQYGAFTGTVNFVNVPAFVGQTGLRFFINAGAFTGFSNATVNLDGNQAWNYNCNSGGNTFDYGALQGTNTSAQIGFLSAGNFPRIVAGRLNTDFTLAAQFVNTAVSLFKTGTGAWTLPANNAHTLSNSIQQGRMIFVTGGSCSNGSQTVISHTAGVGILAKANSPRWVGTNFIFNTGTTRLEFNLAGSSPSTTDAPLLNRGNLTINSSNVLVGIVGGNWSVGQFPLVKYTGTLGGTFGFPALNVTNLPARVQGYLSNNTASTSIDLVVTNTTQPLTWANGSGTWDTTSTFVWRDGAGVFRAYQDNSGFGDSVVFEDTLSGSSPITVTLNSTAVPVSVTHNGAKNFTISGSGGIAGFGSVTKQGSGTLTLGTANSFIGGINLNGGTLSFSALNNLGATASPIIISGGTLQYASGNTADISAGRTVTFGAGGATIDTGANNVTNSAAVGNGGVGGLTKTGSGSLRLSGANNYTGNTVISQGTLALATGASISNSPSIAVASGAILDVTAAGLALNGAVSQTLSGSGSVVGSVTSGTGSSILPGTSPGTLTFSNDLTMAGGTITMDFSTNVPDRDLLIVSGVLTLISGNLQLNPSTVLTNGTYKIIQASGGISGSAGNLLLTGFSQPGQIAFLSDAVAGRIDLVVATGGTNSLVWQGDGGGNLWDVGVSIDWLAGVNPSAFNQGDGATFDATGAANPTVGLTVAIYPSNVTVSANSDYTLQDAGSGLGKLIGPTRINKSGSGTLNILTVNNNTGPTVISGGSVRIGNGSATGSLGNGSITNNSALVFQQTDNRSVNGAIRGTGNLTQNGLTTLTLAGATTYTGPTAIGAGATLQVGNGGANGTLSTSAIADDGRLMLNSSANWTNSAVISGNGELVKLGSGAVTLLSSNTYVGNTYISNGVVKLGASGVIPDGDVTTGWLILDGAATSAGLLDLNGFNETVNALSGLAGTVLGRIANNTGTATNTLTVNDLASTTYAGLILDNTGTGGRVALAKIGANNFTLSGANTYSGGTILGAGILTLRNNLGAGGGSITMSNGTTLALAGLGTGGIGNNTFTPAGATVSFTADNPASGFGGLFTSGDGTSTNSIPSTPSITAAATKQFQNFTGTVRIEQNSSIRFSSTSLSVNGGDNTLFEVHGTLNTRNGNAATGEGIALGALTGDGIVSGAGGGNTGTVQFNIGAKGMDTEFSGQINGVNPASVVITKVGAGTLTLSGTLGYDGSTTVSNGVLALAGSAELDDSSEMSVKSGAFLDVSGISGNLNLGNLTPQALTGSGTIRGSVTAGSSFNVLSPGDGADLMTNTNGPAFFDSGTIGTLTITNGIIASASSQFLMQLNRTNTPINCDRIIAASVAANGATSIIIQNVGPTLQAGDKFILFSVPVSGGYTLIGSGLIAYTIQDNLAVDGSITVTSGLNTNAPVLTNVVSGNTLQLSWPVDHTGWTLQVQTNAINVGISTNWFTVAGSTLTNQVSVPINPANPTVFYRLQLPLP